MYSTEQLWSLKTEGGEEGRQTGEIVHGPMPSMHADSRQLAKPSHEILDTHTRDTRDTRQILSTNLENFPPSSLP